MADELIRVRGIGPAAAEKLSKAGVNSIEQLASSKPEELAFVKGIGINSAKSIIKNAQKIIKLEEGLTKVLDSIKENFFKSCPKCGGSMDKKYIIISPERRMHAFQCRLCKFYLPS